MVATKSILMTTSIFFVTKPFCYKVKELQLITKEFQKRFKTDLSSNPLQATALSKDITEAENEFLIKEVTDDKIFETMKQINPLNAPRPDRMQNVFFEKCLDTVGKSVYEMVKSFFNSDLMLKEIGHILPWFLKFLIRIVLITIDVLVFVIYHIKLCPKY